MNKTYSAGGFVLNSQGQILMIEEYGYYWGMPRGHVEPNESKQQAAVREIREEAGISDLVYVTNLGSYERYTFNEDGRDNFHELKHITFFLFVTSEHALKPADTNITNAQWVDWDAVIQLLIHPKDKEFYQRNLPKILKVMPYI